MERNIAAQIVWAEPIPAVSARHPEANVHALARCNGCENVGLAFLDVSVQGIRDAGRVATAARKLNEANAGHIKYFSDQPREIEVSYAGMAPEMPRARVPEHLPANVDRAFSEAETAMLSKIFTSAAASYGKAVDRAITPFLEGTRMPARPMFGQKIAALESLNIFPPSMLDWMRAVKDDRNFALHDEHEDFTKREQVEPARKFAYYLLYFLYTLPAEVELARGAAAQAGDAEAET